MNFSPSKNRSPSVNQRKPNHRAKYTTYFKTLDDDSRAFYIADNKWQETVKTSSQPSAKLPIERSHENAIMCGMTKGPEVWRNHSSMTVPTVESTENSPDVNQYLQELKEDVKGSTFFHAKRKFLDEGIHRAMYKLKKGKEEIETQVKNLSRFEANLMENKLPITQKDIGSGLLRKDKINKAKRLFLFKEAAKQNPTPQSNQTLNIFAKGSSVLNPPSTQSRIKQSTSTFDDSLTRPPTTNSYYQDVSRKVLTAGSDSSEMDNVLGLQTTVEDTTIDSEVFFDEKYKTGIYLGLTNNRSFTSERKPNYPRGYNNLSTPEGNSRHQRNLRLTTSGLGPSKLIRKDAANSLDAKKRPIVIHSGLDKQKILSGKNVISRPATSNRAMCYGKLQEWFDSLKVSGKNNNPGFKTTYGAFVDQKFRISSKRDADEESCLSFDRSSVTEGNELSKREFKAWNQMKNQDKQTPKLSVTWDIEGNESLKTDVTSRGKKYAFKYGKMIDLELLTRKKMFSQRFSRRKDTSSIAIRTEQSPSETDIGGWSMAHTMDFKMKESFHLAI